MKHLFFTLLACLACCTATLKAQSQASNNFVGIWQQRQVTIGDNGTGHFIKLPVWKVYESNGTFCIFLIANQKADCIKVTEGTYSVVNDSIYEEHISGSLTNSNLVGRSNKIKYTFATPDELVISYNISNAPNDSHESWVRVKMQVPDAQQHENK